MRTRRVALAVGCAACIAATPASAADPGKWVVIDKRTVPAYYRQGIASDPAGDVFFSGSFAGIYRTRKLVEKTTNTTPIPPAVAQAEQYNHIGDIAWDAGEGGRLLLPLESYKPFDADQNPSKTGSIGVMDPLTLKWRYYMKLDPAEIAKTQWVATDEPRGLVWTISGTDLLAYNLSDINLANAAPNGPVIHSVRRLPGAAPDGAGGAVVVGGRIFLSAQVAGVNQIVSVDPDTGASQVEVEISGNEEAEGLEIGPYLNGLLHWELVPGGGLSSTTLVDLVPTGSPLRVKLSKARVRGGKKTPLTATVTVAAGGFRIPLAGVRVSIGRTSAKTDDDGHAKLKVKLTHGSYKAQAFFKGLRTATARLRALAP